MNASNFRGTTRRPAALAVLFLSAWTAPFLPGRDEPARPGREAAARATSARGMLFRREDPKGKWQVVDDKETLHTGDLLLGLPGAALESQDGAVGLKLLVDLDSPLPVLEPAVVLHKARGADLAFTLDRGLVEVANRKEKGSAAVRVTVHGETWDLTLDDPGTRVSLHLYGGWPQGVPFTRKPGPKDVPHAHLAILVQEGQADLKHGSVQHALAAPPGPALMQWDNVTGVDATPTRLDKLPSWALPPQTEAARELARLRARALTRFARAMADRPISEVLDEYLESDNPLRRRLAVIVLAAMDDLERVGKVLHETKHPDTWNDAVRALRHWIGRGPGQDLKLYQGLIEKRHLTPVQAETVLQFLHGFSETDLARPETYEMLIDYLDNDLLAIRGLSYWHLYRLVPQGRDIAYDPQAPKEKRQQARDEWRKLVPSGQLPPKPKLEPKEEGK